MNPMTTLRAAILAGAAAFAAGCRTTPPGHPNVTLERSVRRAVEITDVRCSKGDSAFATFQASVANTTPSELAVQWKTEWYDGTGMAIDSVTTAWNDVAIQPGDVKALKSTAPAQNAVDAQMFIRRKR